jgi:hypothetical protein
MRDIVHEMRNQVPETFFGRDILLAAYMAKPAMHNSPQFKQSFSFLSGRCDTC